MATKKAAKTRSSKATSTQKRQVSRKTNKVPTTVSTTVSTQSCGNNSCKNMSCNGTGGCVYGLGVLGAAIYYISVSTSFWGGVLGVLKAIVWPAMLVFKLLGM